MESDTGEDITEANLSSGDESYKEMEIEGKMFDIANEVDTSDSANTLVGGGKLQPKIKIKKTQSEIQQKSGIWRCPFCSAGFSEPEQYVLHEVKEHGENLKSNDGNVYQCTRCPRSFKMKSDIVNHFLQIHFKLKQKILVSSQIIGTLQSDPGNLRGHLNPQTNSKSAYKRDACSVTFDKSTKFFCRMLQVRGKVFKIRKTEETNKDVHVHGNQYICPESTCSFRGCSKLQMWEHIKQHTDQTLPIAQADSSKTTPAKIDLHLTTEKDKVSTGSLEHLSMEVISTDEFGEGDCGLEQFSRDCPKIIATLSCANNLSPLPTCPATSSSSTSSSSITSNTTRKMV
ncbi:unnamed protein product [Orchesella dallaii]|uniref:C2H2-type domain-containing protein n=1 Tax=Orchesella dallaii TaxID=48710 RepID=A0ABP1R2T3_9HEXA